MDDHPSHDEDLKGTPEQPGAPGGSVLGNLPRERPGRRSPRREPKRPSAATQATRASDPGPPPGERAASGDSGAGAGLEDLAWAGIAVAAEAAALGVRLVNRVLDTGTPWHGRER